MQKYDKNSDGKIEMAEVSPTVLAKGYVGRAVPTVPPPCTGLRLGSKRGGGLKAPPPPSALRLSKRGFSVSHRKEQQTLP